MTQMHIRNDIPPANKYYQEGATSAGLFNFRNWTIGINYTEILKEGTKFDVGNGEELFTKSGFGVAGEIWGLQTPVTKFIFLASTIYNEARHLEQTWLLFCWIHWAIQYYSNSPDQESRKLIKYMKVMLFIAGNGAVVRRARNFVFSQKAFDPLSGSFDKKLLDLIETMFFFNLTNIHPKGLLATISCRIRGPKLTGHQKYVNYTDDPAEMDAYHTEDLFAKVVRRILKEKGIEVPNIVPNESSPHTIPPIIQKTNNIPPPPDLPLDWVRNAEGQWKPSSQTPAINRNNHRIVEYFTRIKNRFRGN